MGPSSLPLIVTCKVSVSSLPIPRWSAMHYTWSLTEGDTPFSSPLTVLPQQPVSFHSSPPVTGAIPPRLCDASEITDLQECTSLTPLFILHAACACTETFKLGSILLAGVAGTHMCCFSGALLLICDPSPGSVHLLLALASNWYDWDALRFLSTSIISNIDTTGKKTVLQWLQLRITFYRLGK